MVEAPLYRRQTSIMDSLPHAATIGRLENWRTAADEFLRGLEARGYTVIAIPEAASLASDELDDRIDEWHAMPDDGRSLHEYLGWTWPEYKAWVETGELPE